MIVVIQRVLEASVTCEDKIVSSIAKGMLIFLGIEEADNMNDIEWLSGKIVGLRIFNDQNMVMNKNIKDVGQDILLVSQFTLHASIKKGNRPSYKKAANSSVAIPIYNQFHQLLEKKLNKEVKKGIFGSDMKVRLTNDGPVTIIIDTKNKK